MVVGPDGTRNQDWLAGEDQQQFTWPTDQTFVKLTTKQNLDVLIAMYEYWRELDSVEHYHN
jgi:hypothetical protein